LEEPDDLVAWTREAYRIACASKTKRPRNRR
jgi:hypothetical protein